MGYREDEDKFIRENGIKDGSFVKVNLESPREYDKRIESTWGIIWISQMDAFQGRICVVKRAVADHNQGLLLRLFDEDSRAYYFPWNCITPMSEFGWEDLLYLDMFKYLRAYDFTEFEKECITEIFLNVSKYGMSHKDLIPLIKILIDGGEDD